MADSVVQGRASPTEGTHNKKYILSTSLATLEKWPINRFYSKWEKPSDQDMTLLDVQEKLAERYCSLCHVESNHKGICSYGYYSEGEPVQGTHELFPVTYVRNYDHEMFDREVVSRWQSLRNKEKHDLFLILYCAKCVFTRVTFSYRKIKWEKRFDEAHLGDNQTTLRSYGQATEGGTDVLTYLAGGNIEEFLQQATVPPDFKLDHHWLAALRTDMMNVHGRTAVFDILDKVIQLLQGFEEEMPAVRLLQVTSPNTYDASSISSSSASGPPPHKTRRTIERKGLQLEGQFNEEERKCEGRPTVGAKRHVSTVKAGENHDSHEDASNNKTKTHRHVDLEVVFFDEMYGQVFDVILVEILSHPETLEEAERKFMKEMIHVLQAQSVVFGLLFGPEEVRVFKAERRKDGEIVFSSVTHCLHDAVNLQHGHFNVGSFQRLVMDILSCVLHGIKSITR